MIPYCKAMLDQQGLIIDDAKRDIKVLEELVENCKKNNNDI